MKNIYYSQIGEDVLINNNFINNPVKDGTYLEVGGSDGVRLSNTKFFHDTLGFRGLLIEPVPMFYKCLIKNRPNDICVNSAVDYKEGINKFIGDSHVAGLDLYLSEPLRKIYLNNAREYFVKTQPISKIIKDSGIKYIDYFSIDVEGGELAVLETMDWTIPVYIITIELNEKKAETDEKGREKNQKCREILLKNGFTFIKQIDINEFWINKNYFRKDLLYDNSIKKFETLKDAGNYVDLAPHVYDEVEKSLKTLNNE